MNDFKHYRGRGRGSFQHNNNFRGSVFNNVRRPNPNVFAPLLPLPHYRDNKHRWQRPPHTNMWRAPPPRMPQYMRPQMPPPFIQRPPVDNRPVSPLPGSEEARQKVIAEASARIKEQLNLDENAEGFVKADKTDQPVPCFNNSLSDNKIDNFNDEIQNTKSERNLKRRTKKPSQPSPAEPNKSVEELRNKILTQFTYMSKGKIQSLVNNPGSSKYDGYLQHLVRDMRLHLSSELRNMYNNRESTTENNEMIDHFNSIVPDLGVELVSLPDTMVAELSKILQFDVNNDIQVSPLNESVNDNALVEPEDMFKQAEKLLLNTDFLDSSFEMCEGTLNQQAEESQHSFQNINTPDSSANFTTPSSPLSMRFDHLNNDPFMQRSPLCNEPPPNINFASQQTNFFPPQTNILPPQLSSTPQSNNYAPIGVDLIETADMDIDDIIDENLAANNTDFQAIDQDSSSNLNEIPLPISDLPEFSTETSNLKTPVCSRDSSPFSKKILEANLPESTNILEPVLNLNRIRSSSIPASNPLFKSPSYSNSPLAAKSETNDSSIKPVYTADKLKKLLDFEPIWLRKSNPDTAKSDSSGKPKQLFDFEPTWFHTLKPDNMTNVTSFLEDVTTTNNLCDSTKSLPAISTTKDDFSKSTESTVKDNNLRNFPIIDIHSKKHKQNVFERSTNIINNNTDTNNESPPRNRLSLDERIKMMMKMQQSGSKKPPEEEDKTEEVPEKQENYENIGKKSKKQKRLEKRKQKLSQHDHKIKVKVHVEKQSQSGNKQEKINILEAPNIQIKQEKVEAEEPTNDSSQKQAQSLNIFTRHVRELNKSLEASQSTKPIIEVRKNIVPTKGALKDISPVKIEAKSPRELENTPEKKIEYRDIPGIRIKRRENLFSNEIAEEPPQIAAENMEENLDQESEIQDNEQQQITFVSTMETVYEEDTGEQKQTTSNVEEAENVDVINENQDTVVCASNLQAPDDVSTNIEDSTHDEKKMNSPEAENVHQTSDVTENSEKQENLSEPVVENSSISTENFDQKSNELSSNQSQDKIENENITLYPEIIEEEIRPVKLTVETNIDNTSSDKIDEDSTRTESCKIIETVPDQISTENESNSNSKPKENNEKLVKHSEIKPEISKKHSTADDQKEEVKSVETNERAKSIDREKSTDRSKSIDRSKSTDRAKSIDRAKSTDRSKSIDRGKSTDRAKSIDRGKSTDRAKSIDRGKSTDRAKSIERAKSIDRAKSIERSKSSDGKDKKTHRGNSAERTKDKHKSSDHKSPKSKPKDKNKNTHHKNNKNEVKKTEEVKKNHSQHNSGSVEHKSTEKSKDTSRFKEDKSKHKHKDQDKKSSKSNRKPNEAKKENEEAIKTSHTTDNKSLSKTQPQISTTIFPQLQQEAIIKPQNDTMPPCDNQSIINRLMNIDMEIQKLMQEKWELYKQLNLTSNSTTDAIPMPAKLIETQPTTKEVTEKYPEINENIKIRPVSATPSETSTLSEYSKKPLNSRAVSLARSETSLIDLDEKPQDSDEEDEIVRNKLPRKKLRKKIVSNQKVQRPPSALSQNSKTKSKRIIDDDSDVEIPKKTRKRTITVSKKPTNEAQNEDSDSDYTTVKKKRKVDKKPDPRKDEKSLYNDFKIKTRESQEIKKKTVESNENKEPVHIEKESSKKTINKNLMNEAKEIPELIVQNDQDTEKEVIPVAEIKNNSSNEKKLPKKRRKKSDFNTSVTDITEEPNKKFFIKIRKPEKKKIVEPEKIAEPEKITSEPEKIPILPSSEKAKSKKLKRKQKDEIVKSIPAENLETDTTNNIPEETETPIQEIEDNFQENETMEITNEENLNNNNESEKEKPTAEYKIKDMVPENSDNKSIKLKIVKSDIKTKDDVVDEHENPPSLRRSRRTTTDENTASENILIAPASFRKKKRKKSDEESLRRSRSRSASKEKSKKIVDSSDEDDTKSLTDPNTKAKPLFSESEASDSSHIDEKIRADKKINAKRKRKLSKESDSENSKNVPDCLLKTCFVKLERINITDDASKTTKDDDDEIVDIPNEIGNTENNEDTATEIIDNIAKVDDKIDDSIDDLSKTDDTLSLGEKETENESKEPIHLEMKDIKDLTDDGEDFKGYEKTNIPEGIEINSDVETESIDTGMFCSGHRKSILDIKVIGDEFLAASEDGTIYKYCLKTGDLQDAYTGHKRAVTCMYVMSGKILDIESTIMYSGSLDCNLKCYNIDTAEILHSVVVEQAIQCMDSAWGYIFLGTYEGLLFIYNIKKKLLNDESLTIANATVLMIKATQEGSRQVLILASRKREIMVRDAFTGLLLRTMCQDQKPTIYSLLLDRSIVYCGTSDKGILILDFNNGTQTGLYNSGKGVVCLVMYKTLLFAGCYDGMIYIYNTKTQKHIITVPGPGEGMLLSLAISDGMIIAGTKKDHLLKIWKIPQEILNQMD